MKGCADLEYSKPATTINEQISILKNKGIIIDDYDFAYQTLFSVNYYTLSGYLVHLENSDGKYDDISFDKIYNIYKCDQKLRSILLYAIESVERNIKTKLAYTLSHSISPMGYLDSNNFIDKAEHEKLLHRFEHNVNLNNRIPFVKHHIVNYSGAFPIWAAIELFTLGMLWNCYKNLKTVYKKEIAQSFQTGVRQLESWIECVSYIRNFAAHNMRLYNFNIQKTPKYCKKNFKDFEYSNKLYDIVYIMKFLVADNSEWNEYILPQIENIFKKYGCCTVPSAYGFPSDWLQSLKK